MEKTMTIEDNKFKANFLWDDGLELGSIEEAGYNFANVMFPEYQKAWWDVLVYRIRVDEGKVLKSLVLGK